MLFIRSDFRFRVPEPEAKDVSNEVMFHETSLQQIYASNKFNMASGSEPFLSEQFLLLAASFLFFDAMLDLIKKCSAHWQIAKPLIKVTTHQGSSVPCEVCEQSGNTERFRVNKMSS